MFNFLRRKSKEESKEKSKKKALKEVKMSEKGSDEKPSGKGSKKEIDPDSLTHRQLRKYKKREKKAVRKAKRRARPIPLRILLFIFKNALYRIPVIIIIIIGTVLIGLKIYLSPERVESLIKENFNKLSHGEISLKVSKFSPYSGFIMENIVIKNGEEFGRTDFVRLKKLAVRYGLFRMLTGKVRIPEIGIYKPEIFLVEKNGVWNAARLMKPGEKKPEKKKEEEKIKEEKKEEKVVKEKEVSLPIAVEFLFKFILDDLKLYIDSKSFKSSIEGLTFSLDIDIPPFKKIPLDIKAVKLLDKLNVVLNPSEEMKISFKSKEAELSPPLILTWKLIFAKGDNRDDESARFNSVFKFGMYKAPVRFKRSYLTPLNFMVSYDLFYNPILDNLKLNHLGIEFMGKKWIYLTGNVESVKKDQQINLSMTESNIYLNDLYSYFLSVTKKRSMKFSGSISLAPLTIKGNPRDINLKGRVLLDKIRFRQPGMAASIPYLKLSYNIRKREKADYAGLTGNIEIKRLYFSNPAVAANIPYFNLKYNVRKVYSNIAIQAGLRIPHLFYTLAGSRSGDNGLELNTDIASYGNFSRVNIKKFGMRFYSPQSGKNALDLAISGNIKLKPRMSGNVTIEKFRFQKGPLVSMVTDKLRKNISSIPLKKPLDMGLNLKFALGDITSADLSMNLKVPDFQVKNLTLRLDVIQDNKNKTVNLKKFSIISPNWNASIYAAGILGLKKVPFSNADVNLKVKLHNKEMKTMFPPWDLSGLIELSTSFKGDLETGKASGYVKLEKLFVKNEKGRIFVDDFNLDFPFEYNMKSMYTGESKITAGKTQIFNNENFNERVNFTIKSIRAKHPARDLNFEFLKDFEASMFFSNNVFQIKNMKAYTLDGALYGEQILFNLADTKPKNMEYKLVLDMTNIDINKLDEPNPAKKTREAELSLNVNLSGRGVEFAKEVTAKGYINIFKIGDDFANRLMKGLSREKGKSKLGGIGQWAMDNSMKVKGFNFNIDKGLMYTTVSLYKSGFFGYIVGIQDDRIKFDRMKVQEFLRNIMKGDDE